MFLWALSDWISFLQKLFAHLNETTTLTNENIKIAETNLNQVTILVFSSAILPSC
jgi:hypothetical protein